MYHSGLHVQVFTQVLLLHLRCFATHLLDLLAVLHCDTAFYLTWYAKTLVEIKESSVHHQCCRLAYHGTINTFVQFSSFFSNFV